MVTHPSDTPASGPPRPAKPAPYALRRVETDDVDAHADSLSAWGRTYDQLSPGSFTGALTEVWTSSAQVFRETTSQSMRQSCCVWPGAWWFGIPLDDQAPGSIGGRRFGIDTLAVRPGGCEFELMTPAGFDILGLVADHDALDRHAAEVEHRDLSAGLAHAPVLDVGLAPRQRLAQFVLHVLAEVGANPGVQSHPAARRMLDQAVLAAALAQFETAPRPARGKFSQQRIFASVRDHVLARADEPVTVPDLCRAFHVSRRTLQYCFQELAGMSPGAYLRAIRLNAVRRDLKDPASPHRTVQDAAAARGFWHLSQFAIDYRKLFGERPSQTLHARWRQVPGLRPTAAGP